MHQLYLPDAEPLAATINSYKHYGIPYEFNWQLALKEKTTTNQMGLFNVEGSDSVTLYRSGVSSKSDLQGVMQSGVPVCVCILETSDNVKGLLTQYANNGHRILFDSGAFGAFKKSLKTNEVVSVDFNKVLTGYLNIIDNCKFTHNLTFVAPDIVGEQAASLAIFNHYVSDCIQILKSGARLMVPLQQGQCSLSQVANQIKSMLPVMFHSKLTFGLPSNAKAIQSNDVIEFVSTTHPTAIHFLGCSETSLAYKAKYLNPDIDVSCDANRIRKWVGQRKLLTQMHSSVLDEAIDNAWCGSSFSYFDIGKYDFTEFVGYLDDFVSDAPGIQVQRLAKILGCTVIDLEQANQQGHLIEYIDSLNYGYSDNYLYQFYESELRKEISPKVRTFCISKFADCGLI